jgi:hypothetical protein
MQYNFTLPADFDTEVIRQRVTAKGGNSKAPRPRLCNPRPLETVR